MQREIRVDGRRYFVLSEGSRLLLQTDCGKFRFAVNEAEGIRFVEPEPGADPKFVHAPWTEDEVRSLNGYQTEGYGHPFTYGDQVTLIATPMGWVAEKGGPVVQTWAWKFMADDTWKQNPIYQFKQSRGL